MSAATGHRAVHRYAEALYEAAAATGEEERIGGDLARLAQLWKDIPQLPLLLTHPLTPTKEKESVLEQTFGGDLHPYTVNALRLMIRRGRGAFLPQLRSAFLRAAEENGRLVRAILRSARPLSPEDLNKVKSQLRGATGRAVVLEVEPTPALLAGAELEVAGRRLDVSLRRRLERLAEELKG